MKSPYKRFEFQGQSKMEHKNYFEGWYYKQVSGDGNFTISFIPGISTNKEDPHAFIQCIYAEATGGIQTHYFRYALDDFYASVNPFEIKIGQSIFKKKSIFIHLEDQANTIKGSLEFGKMLDLKRSVLQPNIMGVFTYVPGLECNHEIVSMDHSLNGRITINEKSYSFDGGRGYLEKDWGTSFPEKYIWIQSNHFDQKDVSLCCSIASFPVMGIKTQGFFCNLTHNGAEYRFATYNFSRVKTLESKDGIFKIEITKGHLILTLDGQMTHGEDLLAPNNGKMSYTIKEGLSGIVQVSLRDKSGQVILKSNSKHCGMEIVGY